LRTTRWRRYSGAPGGLGLRDGLAARLEEARRLLGRRSAGGALGEMGNDLFVHATREVVEESREFRMFPHAVS